MSSDPLRQAEEALDALARHLDADLVSTSDAAELVARLSRLERRCGGMRTVLARRAVESDRWRACGTRSGEDSLARETGCTRKAAAEVVDRSNKLAGLDATRAAVLEGELSDEQARLVIQGAATDADAEGSLLDSARTDSVGGLRRLVREVRRDAASREKQDAREKRIRDQRRYSTWSDEDGAWAGTIRGPALSGAGFEARLKPFVDDAFNAARNEGRREPYEAYRFDGLVAMARAATANRNGDGEKAGPSEARLGKIIVRCDAAALARGHTIPGEVCEIAGIGPVPVTVVEQLAHSDPFWAAVLMDGEDVHTVAHLGRRPRAIQRTALDARDRECVVAGCNNTHRLEVDHELDWAATRRTKVTDLDLLCHDCHARKTRHGWRLRRGVGKRPLLPPHHPDHPGQPVRDRGRRRPPQPTSAPT
jgi:hypothetical protein